MSAATGRAGDGVVTIGETMALLTSPSGRHLRGGSRLPVGIGGAESNVAIGLARLDVPVTWISRVGDDAFGSLVVREIRAEGVQVSATVDPDARTGLMVKEQLHGTPWRVRYYRDGSAASRLATADIEAASEAIAAARVLHLTGITAALSASAPAAVHRAVEIARAAGTLVSFDVNHRAALWSADEAAPVLAELCAAADLVFAGTAEAALVLGTAIDDRSDDESLARGVGKLGPSTVVLKLGARGALALTGDRTTVAPTEPVDVVDPVGAGDAFVAGYLSALVQDRPVAECLQRGNLVGGAVCRVPGDWEGLPTPQELEQLGSHLEDVVR
jgi:2-dehydro-3-deoxygluconokinase